VSSIRSLWAQSTDAGDLMQIDLMFKKFGPLFNGQAEHAVNAFIEDAKEQVAQVGVNDVHAELRRVLQHPTGYYESRIQTEQQRNDVVITDGDVIYGPWLEGTSSRNSTTRFKGYATFRRVTQKLQNKANNIASGVLDKYIGRMG
jgi:hypothetical protein